MQVERGFLHLHTKLSHGHANLHELASTLLNLVDLLVAQGLISVEELRAQAARVRDRLAATDHPGPGRPRVAPGARAAAALAALVTHSS